MIGQKHGKDKTMYESNIYIKNYATIKKYAGDIGVQLDKFDNAHHLKHNALARALALHPDRCAGAAECRRKASAGAVKQEKPPEKAVH